MPEHADTDIDIDPAPCRRLPTDEAETANESERESESDDESAESDLRDPQYTETHQTTTQSTPMTHPSTHEFQTDGIPGGLLFENTVEDATAYFAVVLDADDTSSTASIHDETDRDAVLETAIRTVLADDGVATPTRIAHELAEGEHRASTRTITTLVRGLDDLAAAPESERETHRPGWPDAHDQRGAPNPSHPTGGD